jgi:predicted ester cyclase
VKASIEVVFNNCQYDRIPEFYTEEFVCHPTGIPINPWRPGRDGLEEHVRAIKEVFPDYTEYPKIVFGDGDMVIVRQEVTGTNNGKGPFGGEAGKKFTVIDMMICRLRDGKLDEQWGLTDRFAQFVQLGIVDVHWNYDAWR